MESDPQARPDTILVTGSSGYLGYAVARRLSRRYAVVGLDRRAPSHPPPSAECLYVDLTSEASLARALDAVRDLHGDRVASVLHFAAYYDFSGAPSPLYERVTVQGTARLLRLLRERFTVEQFVFSSTMLVHAPTTPGRPITEASPLAPRWPYPQSKVRTEAAIRSGRGDVPAVLLRLAGVYDDLGHTLPLPRQIQRIYERLPEAFLFPGDLSHGQAMVHLHDVVDLYERLVAHRRTLPPEVTLLAGEPETLGYGELQRLIGRLVHGEAWATRPIPRWLARAAARWGPVAGLGTAAGITPAMVDLADDHYELDITRARTLLGWTPQRSLRETLPAITAALLADPWAWYRENELPMPPWLEETVPRPAAPPGPIAGISDEQVARIETMAIADASAQGPAHDDQGHGAAPSRSEHARRAEPRGHAHHAVHEGETGQEAHRVHALHPPAAVAPPPRRDDLEARLRRLDALRNFQSLLEVARRRELARQLARDDEAQRLMETDPRGHVAMMRPMQEDEALVRELPEEVLRQEAALYGEIVRLRGPQPPPRALPDPLMTGMVVGERWVHVTVLTLGAWLLAAPSALAYPRAALAWSDMTSGALVIALAALTLTGRRWAPWANALVGLWVMFAPLLFWTPSPAVYAVDTVVGALIVGLVVIVPMRTPMPGTDVPPGWSYNPSTWVQRLPIVALALASFFMARHMAAFQLGHLETAWDPIFGRGTARILTSEVSRAFPVSDAGLGAYTYMIEVLSGLMGDTRRWATMPWMAGDGGALARRDRGDGAVPAARAAPGPVGVGPLLARRDGPAPGRGPGPGAPGRLVAGDDLGGAAPALDTGGERAAGGVGDGRSRRARQHRHGRGRRPHPGGARRGGGRHGDGRGWPAGALPQPAAGCCRGRRALGAAGGVTPGGPPRRSGRSRADAAEPAARVHPPALRRGPALPGVGDQETAISCAGLPVLRLPGKVVQDLRRRALEEAVGGIGPALRIAQHREGVAAALGDGARALGLALADGQNSPSRRGRPVASGSSKSGAGSPDWGGRAS